MTSSSDQPAARPVRYLAIDLGGRRTGLAVGDSPGGHIGPVGMIEERDTAALVKAVAKAVDEYAADAVVVGMPFNADGSVGAAAERAEQFARALEAALGLPVHRADERLTSYAADQQMSRTGYTRGQKKARRDALAAAAILRDFLAGRE